MSDEPDEALIWAREDAAQQCEKYGPMPGVDFPAEYRAGLMDVNLDDPVRAYRAGQAASAERIKALEEALRDALDLCENANEGAFRNGVSDYSNTMDEGEVLAWKYMDHARALLKEADQ